MGTTNPFSSLFGKSPFKALQQHMRVATECASHVPALMEALGAADQGKVQEIANTIFDLERQADELKNTMRAQLPKSLFMPVDRRDLLEVLQIQDAISDVSQDIAGLLLVRNMEVPVGMNGPLVALAKRCVDACDQAARIIEELDELVEMGFGGRESAKVQEMIDDLCKIENETDKLGIDLTKDLFSHEDEMKPVAIMFWYQLIQWVGNLGDNAEKVGDRLRLLLAR